MHITPCQSSTRTPGERRGAELQRHGRRLPAHGATRREAARVATLCGGLLPPRCGLPRASREALAAPASGRAAAVAAHLLQKDAAKEAGCARDALAVGRQRPGTPRGLSWGRVGGRHPRAPSRMRPPCATVASAARVTSTPGVFVGACHDEAPRHGRTENRRVGMVAAHRTPDEEVRGVVMTEGAWADL